MIVASERNFKYGGCLPISMDDQLVNRIKGCIIGGAIGDALGMPVEGMEKKRVLSLDYQQPHPEHPNRHLFSGQFTDDTIQTLIIAKSLIEKQGFDLFHLEDMLKKWYDNNKNNKKNMRWIGKTSKTSLRRLSYGTSPFRAGDKDTQSNGSLTRVAPIALYYDNIDIIRTYAKQSSIITHNSQVAKEACSFFATALYYLLHNEKPITAIEIAEKEITDKILSKSVNEAKQRAINMLEPRHYDDSTNIVDTLPIAIYSFLRSPANFEEALALALKYSGSDTDTTLSLTGQLVGSYVGLGAVPERFINGLEKSHDLDFVVDNLIKGAESLYVPFDIETIAEKNPNIPREDTMRDSLRYVGQYLGYLRRKIIEIIGKPRFVSLSDHEETYIYQNQIDLTFIQEETLSASRCKVILPYSQKDTFKQLMELKRTLEK